MKIQPIQPWIKNFITSSPQTFKVLRLKGVWITPYAVSWEEVSLQTNYSVETLKELNPFLSKFKTLKPRTNVTTPGKAVGVSYTEEGLKWVCNNRCEALYFEDTKLSAGHFEGPLTLNPDVIIEDFVPRDHYFSKQRDGSTPYIHKGLQVAEFMAMNKAFRMLYVPSIRDSRPDKVEVYNSRLEDNKKLQEKETK